MATTRQFSPLSSPAVLPNDAMGADLAAVMLRLQINWQKSSCDESYTGQGELEAEQTHFVNGFGNSVTQHDNGYVRTLFADGSCEEVYPDGSYSYQNADGSGWLETATASGGFFNADGTKVAWDDEGNGMYNYPDGSVEYYRVDAASREALDQERKSGD